MKLHALKFALAAGISFGLCAAAATAAALIGIPGFAPFAEMISSFYGPWGYTISWPGVVVGAMWGFVEGFVHIGFLGLVYNWLTSSRKGA